MKAYSFRYDKKCKYDLIVCLDLPPIEIPDIIADGKFAFFKVIKNI